VTEIPTVSISNGYRHTSGHLCQYFLSLVRKINKYRLTNYKIMEIAIIKDKD
jgi:hypothetical protein